jgi:hypothetical protein
MKVITVTVQLQNQFIKNVTQIYIYFMFFVSFYVCKTVTLHKDQKLYMLAHINTEKQLDFM